MLSNWIRIGGGGSFGGRRAIFMNGSQYVSITTSAGAMGATSTVAGTQRGDAAAAGYGLDKALFFGGSNAQATTILVSNVGVLSADVPGVAGVTGRRLITAADYGVGKAIAFAGLTAGGINTAITNLISNTGVVAADTPAVAGVTATYDSFGVGYGADLALFACGSNSYSVTRFNYVNNLGVMAADSAVTAGSSIAAFETMAARYGTGTAFFWGGRSGTTMYRTMSLVGNTGAVAAAVTYVSAHTHVFGEAAACGLDIAVLAFGANTYPGTYSGTTNIVSNTGIVSANITTAAGVTITTVDNQATTFGS